MQTGITNEPPRSRASVQGQYPEQIVYTLDQHDYAAYLMFLRDRGPGRIDALVASASGVGALALLCALIAAWCFWSAGELSHRVWPVPSLGLGAGASALSLVLAYLARRQSPAQRRERRSATQQRIQKTLGGLEPQGELINRDRIHWLLLEPDALVVVSELRTEKGGLSRSEQREERAEWDLVDEVVVAEHNVFLLREDGGCWILPLSAFADRGAALRFAEKVRDLRQAALDRQPNDERSEGVQTAP